MVEGTFEPGMTARLIARRRDVASKPTIHRGRLVAGNLTAADSGEEMVPTSDYRALAEPSSRASSAAGQKDLEAEFLKGNVGTRQRITVAARRRHRMTVAMKTVADVIGFPART
jgi:hypothetical protein